jgi:uncharacterized protein YodC (DUF2158 family)
MMAAAAAGRGIPHPHQVRRRTRQPGVLVRAILVASIKVGDLVKLRSGGPAMTVTAVPAAGGGTAQVKCCWFEHNEAGHPVLREVHFPLQALNLEQSAGDAQVSSGDGTMGEILARSLKRQQEMARQKMPPRGKRGHSR